MSCSVLLQHPCRKPAQHKPLGTKCTSREPIHGQALPRPYFMTTPPLPAPRERDVSPIWLSILPSQAAVAGILAPAGLRGRHLPMQNTLLLTHCGFRAIEPAGLPCFVRAGPGAHRAPSAWPLCMAGLSAMGDPRLQGALPEAGGGQDRGMATTALYPAQNWLVRE